MMGRKRSILLLKSCILMKLNGVLSYVKFNLSQMLLPTSFGDIEMDTNETIVVIGL